MLRWLSGKSAVLHGFHGGFDDDGFLDVVAGWIEGIALIT